MTFEPIDKLKLQIGQPVPWNLYDGERNLLLARGVTIESAQHIDQIASRGLFRKVGNNDESQGNTSAPSREELRPLEEIKLGIGDTLHLQSQSEGTPLRYAVKLIGYLRGKGLIVTTPLQDGKVLLMRDGQSFIVRLFSGKSVYAFPANIFKVANVPYPHLHLTWPKQVKGLVIRRGARANVNLIAATTDAKGNAGAARLENLSTGGCSLFSTTRLGNPDDRIRIKFRVLVSEVEQYLDLEGVVRSVQLNADIGAAQPMQHGVQFVNPPPSEQIALTAYVYHALFEEAASS